MVKAKDFILVVRISMIIMIHNPNPYKMIQLNVYIYDMML